MRRFPATTSCAALALGLGLLVWGPPAAAAPAVLPQPLSIQEQTGAAIPAAAFQVEWSGHRDPALERAAQRFGAYVALRTGIDARLVKPTRLRIICAGPDPDALTLKAKEAYRLTVEAEGVTLTAEGPIGVLRGLATLRQAITSGPEGFVVPRMQVDDRPRFAWRGVMIDVARHFMTLETLKRQIDAMEQVKLNVLHLHLSDNEGFRVESRRYPKLQALASGGEYYTQAQVRELVVYAAERGVRIVPEFDVPGHSRALLAAYPELASRKGEADGAFAALNSALDPSLPETYAFLGGLFSEMAELFPDRYFHVGGDEVAGGDWASSPRVQDFMRRNGLTSKVELEAYFHRQVRDIAAARGKTMIGWEEIAHAPIADDVLVQAWRGSAAIARGTGQGNRVIVSAGYYLDLLETGESHYQIDPLDAAAYGMDAEEAARARAHPVLKSLLHEDVLKVPGLQLTAAQQALVLGGEAALWSELVTDEMLDGRLWPRAAVIAERLWSPAEVRDTDDLYRRLLRVQDGLRMAGLKDEANRDRMIARLSPGESEPVALLVSLVSPVRNFAHKASVQAIFHGRPGGRQDFNQLADIASPDSLVARRFGLDVRALIGGERAGAPALKAELRMWRDNHVRFLKVAEGRPMLQAAAPVSADIAALAELGLEAVGFIEAGRRPKAEWRARAAVMLEKQAAAERASSTFMQTVASPNQPPADLLIAIARPIGVLVAAAEGR
ncbi:beta-N-acetylhexosaminidase [Phenylobacterium sp. Root700]|uniref:beta-N-acetylhexosaminidase n=1 Tax=Phenylobacterium sp. Root700 TaxID=1736591 RepID=UPI000AECBECF|nr:family 20 glycosylhydrolase [Phenylobacterium sp. Root700]